MVQAVYGALHADHGLDSPSRGLDAARLAERLGEATGLLVEASGAVAGFAFVRPSRDVAGALYLGTVATDPALRGRGVAALLVAEAMAVAREGGWPDLVLDTFDGPGGAAGYFARHGFAPRGTGGPIRTMGRRIA
nr:GNAT family N-acetyltransferase [Jannaschia sp. Os4]